MRRLLATAITGTSAAVVAAALGLALATPAWAQVGECDVLVVDRTGNAAADDATDVAARLDESRAVFARARLVDDAPGGDLDAWAGAEVAACPSWQTGEGDPRGDLLLLVVDLDARVIGSYFGDGLAPGLEPLVNDVHDRMRPALAEGDWGEALVVGLAAYGDELGIDTDSPTSVLPLVVGGGVVLAGGAGAVALVRGRRRRTVQGQAEEAKTQAMSTWFDLESRWETIAASVTVMTQAVHPDDGVAATVEQEADEAERVLDEVREELLTLPDPDDVTTQQEADDAVEAWSRVADRIATVTIEVDEVEAAVAALTDAKQQAPGKAEQAAADVARAQDVVTALGEQLVDGTPLQAPAAQAWASDAAKGVEAARTALEAGRFGDAVVAAEAASARAAEAIARAEQVPALARDLPGKASDLAEAAAEVERAAASAKNTLTTLRSKWRRTVWDDISDAPDRATDLAQEAAEEAQEAAAAAALDVQDWEAALAALETGAALVAEATDLAGAAADRGEEAEAALTRARSAVAEARDAASAAESTLAGARADVEAHRVSLSAAARQAEKAASLLDDKPDPIRAVQIAGEAMVAIRRAEAGAREAIAAWEREQQRAQQVLARARQELDRAERDRPRSRRFDNDLRTANAIYGDAASEADHDPRAAANQAERALDIARRVIREKRRERDRDRDQWRAPRGRSVSGPLGGVLGGAVGTAGRANPRRTTRTVLGGSPTRSAPRRSSSTGRRSASKGSSKRGGFGGGGTSKF